jgi:poly(3-hydroxybutyrate) depolymerase
MLYVLHEFQHALLAPWNQAAKVGLELFSNPFSPLAYFPESRRAAAGAELFYRLTQRYEKPAFGLDSTQIDGRAVAVHERVVLGKPFCRLLHFERDFPADMAGRQADPTVLLVAPLSGHFATLLRDTVRSLLPEHEVYVTDWVDARMVPLSQGPFHLDDYVDYVREFIRFLGPDVHVISVCQPTVPVLAAVSLMATDGEAVKPRTMVMMGGPIDARRSPTAVNNLALEKPYSWFERSVIERVPVRYPGYMRRVYPGFLQHMGFVAMNPSRHASAHWDFYNHLIEGDDDSAEAHRQFYDEYNAVLDMPAEYYLDTVRRVFQEFQLPRGRFFVRDRLVRPQDILDTALLTVEGELDDISGNGQTQAAHDLCTGIPAARREHFEVAKAGHYGIFSGRRWREIVYPKIKDFIRTHAAPA